VHAMAIQNEKELFVVFPFRRKRAIPRTGSDWQLLGGCERDLQQKNTGRTVVATAFLLDGCGRPGNCEVKPMPGPPGKKSPKEKKNNHRTESSELLSRSNEKYGRTSNVSRTKSS